MQCPVCGERSADARYYRLNTVTEGLQQLCRPCWLALRKAERGEWRYFRGVGRLIFLYTVLPAAATALAVWLLATWLL
jgi:hypothetical protein